MSFTSIDSSTLGLYEAAKRNGSSSFMQTPSDNQFWGKDGPSFKSVLDTINPLQQLPVIGSIYRSATGDTISTAARLAGGALYGGPLGLLGAAANAVIEGVTGADIGGHVINTLSDAASAATPASGALTPVTMDSSTSPDVHRSAYLAYNNASKLG